ncbi:MAG: hypothetical protein R8J94_14355 [Acidimicrobiia bacterium]|nr:hypothetical protein [Acidimicrobiia bacterium]
MSKDAEAIDEGAEETIDEEYVDELPEDLNAADFVGPYLFPNNSKRRIPGILYLLIGAGILALWFFGDPESSPLINGGLALSAVLLIVVGLYHLQAGWNLDVDEQDALVEATKSVGFPVGHASAQMAWRGLRSRPTWRILLYSNESPPKSRGFVMVDGVDGEIVHSLVEDNPEDWAALEPATDTESAEE